MCLGRELVKGEANLALHGLGGEVAGLHVPLQQEQLVGHLPGVDLPGEGGREGREEGGRGIVLTWMLTCMSVDCPILGRSLVVVLVLSCLGYATNIYKAQLCCLVTTCTN